jgi:CHAD domain-containing protein
VDEPAAGGSLLEFTELQIVQRLKVLARCLKKVDRRSTEDHIHQLRVAGRRLQSMLRAFPAAGRGKDETAEKKFLRRLKKLMNDAAAVRNCDISKQLLLTEGLQPSRLLLKQLNDRRENAKREFRKRLRRKWLTNQDSPKHLVTGWRRKLL